ncbi:MAG: OmpA family protein [Gemmatimonadota bacterium]
MQRKLATVTVLGLAIGLTACTNHVTQEQLDEQLSEIRAQQEKQDKRISQNEQAIRDLRAAQKELRGALEKLRRNFDSRINELENRLVLALPIHFEFDRAQIRPVDEPLLNRFAATVREHMSEGVITVEGFADPAGSDAYNQQLSRERAQAVKNYLVKQGNLNADQIRAVGYGENRLVTQEAGPGRAGIENRRVTFVVEFSGEVGG